MLSPKEREVRAKELLNQMKISSDCRINSTVDGYPTLSKTGQNLDIHVKAIAYGGITT